MSYTPKQVISIYNYPEHLNPFYGDEQHKRLRFWKINSKKQSDLGSRRGSFNFGSLRDLFSPFGLKKRSSTQSVNKTSESPPPLRRDLIGDISADEEFKYSSYDPHFRHTVSANFQRDLKNRSSLQNMNDFSFGNRNARYRSTVQYGTSRNSNGRYAGPSSVTPTPTSRFSSNNNSNYGMTPGSSMNSVNSTNPFDDDYEVDSMTIASGSSHLTDHKRPRKKRRAPLPPVNHSTPNSNVHKLCIQESGESQENDDGLQELTRLTAEFESFVKTSENIEDKRIEDHLDGEQRPHIVERRVENGADTKEDRFVVSRVDSPESVHVRQKIVKQNAVVHEPSVEVVEKSSQNHKTNEVVEMTKEVKSSENHKTVSKEIEVVQVTESPVTIEHAQSSETVTRRIEVVRPTRAAKPAHIPQKTIKTDERNESSRVEVHEPLHIKKQTVREEKIVVNKEERIPATSNIIANHSTKPTRASETFDLRIDEVVIVEPVEVEKDSLEVRQYPEVREITPSSREQTPDYIPMTVREKFHVLKIEEREVNVPKTEEKFEASPVERPVMVQKVAEVKIQEVKKPETNEAAHKLTVKTCVRETTPAPKAFTEMDDKLKMHGFFRVEKPIEFYEPIEDFLRKSHTLRITETENDDDAPKPPERRRSVKDIIESINRSQQMLGVNRGSQSLDDKPLPPSKANVLLKLQRQAESEQRIEKLLADLQNFDKENPRVERTNEFPCDDEHSRINPVAKPRRVFES